MKKDFKKNVLVVLERAIRLEVQKNEKGNLPICPLILHQPKRPKKM